MENTATENTEEGAVPTETAKSFVPVDEELKKQIEYKDEGWSWGGFALNLFFLIALRKYSYLLLMLLLLIPLLNIVVMFGVMIYAGIKGREIARTSRTFSNHEQYLGFMKGVDHAGKVFAVFYISLIVIGITASIVLASLSGARERAQDAAIRYQEHSQEIEMEYRR